MCKRFIIFLSWLATHVKEPTTYRSGKSPKIIAEKALLYELLSLSKMVVKVDGHFFHSKFLSAITYMLKTKLKDKKLDDKIEGTRDDEAF